MTWPDETLQGYPGRFHRLELIRFAHLDLSLTGDATGVVVGCVSGFDRVQRGDTTETLPRIRIDFALQVCPPKGGEIPFEKIRSLIYKLRDLGLNIRCVSADTYQSADTLQLLGQQDFGTGVRSIDRDPRPYDVLKTALYDGRVELPAHDALLRELLALGRDAGRSPSPGCVTHTGTPAPPARAASRSGHRPPRPGSSPILPAGAPPRTGLPRAATTPRSAWSVRTPHRPARRPGPWIRAAGGPPGRCDKARFGW